MSIAASSVECDDLRLSYSGVMSQIEIVPDGSMTLTSSQNGGPVSTDQAKSSTSAAGAANIKDCAARASCLCATRHRIALHSPPSVRVCAQIWHSLTATFPTDSSALQGCKTVPWTTGPTGVLGGQHLMCPAWAVPGQKGQASCCSSAPRLCRQAPW